MRPLAYQRFSELVTQGCLRNGMRILIGFSGGPDSRYLYHFLVQASQRLPLVLQPLHFNHGLRPEAAAEAEFCRQVAQGYGHELWVKEGFAPSGDNLQQAARHWRRGEFLHWIHQGWNAVALGHHQDDLIETLLFRLLRGASLFSLNPMQTWDAPWLRPLLPFSKAEILAALAEEGLSFVQDASNQLPQYQRNRLRNELMPLLDQLAPPGWQGRLAALSRDAALLETDLEQALSGVQMEGESLDYALLNQLPPLFAQEAIHRFLRGHGCSEPRRSQIEEIYSLVVSGKGGWRLHTKGCLVQGRKGRLWGLRL